MTGRLRGPKPLNLTARAALAYQVPGNPAISRPEDAVANCYPGLELDVRNFDRRFFPGMVFEFVARSDTGVPYTQPQRYGARLAYLDLDEDPDLIAHPDLRSDLSRQAGRLGEGDWYIEWIKQGGKHIVLREDRPGEAPQLPMDGLFVWRLVRGLEPDQVTIGLQRRYADSEAQPQDGDAVLAFTAKRRRFADERTGVISLAYKPGELLQSLCSPWQHDFRDCYCHYWASNHPDLVFGEVAPGEPSLPNGGSGAEGKATKRLDWLRADRTPQMAAAARNTFSRNRPFQFDHFEINDSWKRLSVVINDTEIGNVYVPRIAENATPFASTEELERRLRRDLAPLEMALSLEYLYAMSSLVSEREARKAGGRLLADAVAFAREALLQTAISEMHHLRWVNELLWQLHTARSDGRLEPAPENPRFEPVLEPARQIPTGHTDRHGQPIMRRRGLRPLTRRTLQDFIDVEHPSGFIDGAYARVIATLRQPQYPPHLQQLAERIAAEGMEHAARFLDMRAAFRPFAPAEQDPDKRPPYVRKLRLPEQDDAAVKQALGLHRKIVSGLGEAYRIAATGDRAGMGKKVTEARNDMFELLQESEKLAERGIGVPYWNE